MNFVIIGGLVVLFFAFSFVVWKAAKDWRWYNIVAVLITMLLAMVFIFPTAGALKSRAAWHKVKENLEVRADKALKEQKNLKYGDAHDPTAGPGVLDLAQQLSKVGIEAGRRWRGLRMANNNVQSIQLNKVQQAPPPGVVAAADPDAAAPAAAAGPLIPQDMVVYGFSEAIVQGVDGPVPTFYLGEFKVTASTPTGVTLVPTGPLEQNQQQRIGGGQASSWSLYELLPLDAHEPFVTEGSTASDDNVFGSVDENLIRGMLQWTPGDGQRLSELSDRLQNAPDPDISVVFTPAEQLEYRNLSVRGQTFKNYLRDGSRSTADDPPLSRWVLVEFTKNFTLDVDSPQQTGALEGGFFDGNGRAVDSRLQRGDDGNVKFKAGDRIVVKEEAATQLTDVDGVARLVDEYFIRPLNDYRFVLRRIRLRLTELSIRSKELKYENAVLAAAKDATEAMLVLNQKEKLKLEQDLAQTQGEAKAIRGYHDKLEDEVKKTRERLVALYQDNQRLEQQLQKAHGNVKAAQ